MCASKANTASNFESICRRTWCCLYCEFEMSARHHPHLLPVQCTEYIQEYIVPALAKVLLFGLFFEDNQQLLRENDFYKDTITQLYTTFVQITDLKKRFYAAKAQEDTDKLQNDFDICAKEADLTAVNSDYDQALSSLVQQTTEEDMQEIYTLLDTKGMQMLEHYLHTAEWEAVVLPAQKKIKEDVLQLESNVLLRAVGLAASAIGKSQGDVFKRAEAAMRKLLQCVKLYRGSEANETTAFDKVLQWKQPISATCSFWADLHLILDVNYTVDAHLRPGARVELHSIFDITLNGKLATVMAPAASQDASDPRVMVKVDNVERPLSIKTENLRPFKYYKQARGFQKLLGVIVHRDPEWEITGYGYKVLDIRPNMGSLPELKKIKKDKSPFNTFFDPFLRVNDVIMDATLEDEPQAVRSKYKSVDKRLVLTVMRPQMPAFKDDALPSTKLRHFQTTVEVHVPTSTIWKLAAVQSNVRVLPNSVVFDLCLPDFSSFIWQITMQGAFQSNVPYWHQCAALLQDNHDDRVDIVCLKGDTEKLQLEDMEYVTLSLDALEQNAAVVEVPMSLSELQENQEQQQQADDGDDDDDLYD